MTAGARSIDGAILCGEGNAALNKHIVHGSQTMQLGYDVTDPYPQRRIRFCAAASAVMVRDGDPIAIQWRICADHKSGMAFET